LIVTPSDPWLRFLFGIVVVAVAIRLMWDLLRPVLPVLAVVTVVFVAVRVAGWWRGRW
jgi:hypothetical protein